MVSDRPLGRAGAASRRTRAIAWALTVFAVVVGLDQLVKHTVGTGVAPGQVKTVIPGVVHLVYVRNTGVAFGFLSGGGAVVYAITAIALIALVVHMLRHPERSLLWLPTGMLVGGAVGNLIDRVALGSVIDFIELPHWPAFNLADMAITFGVIILVVVIERGGRERGGESAGTDA